MRSIQKKIKKLEAAAKNNHCSFFEYKGKMWSVVETRDYYDLTTLPTPETRQGIYSLLLNYILDEQTPEQKEWYDAFWAHREATLTEKEKEENKIFHPLLR